MITTTWILGMWAVVILGMYLFVNVCFWVFAQLFGMVDNYMQDRYWRKRGYRPIKDDNGKEWYVSETLWP